MNILEIKDACFSYGDHPVFRNVSFGVGLGEVVCLMGMNGCGKSTILDCVLGEKQLESGQVLIAEKPVERYKPSELARYISFVPQTHQRSFPYTVEQVVLMGRTAQKDGFFGPGGEDMQLVRRALEKVGIPHLAQRPYTQISGGELQLVVLARALAQDTPVVLMDEPTAHLDFRNELIFMETVVNLVREKETALLLATHAPNQAFYFESKGLRVKVAAMCGQTVRFIGSPKQVLTPKRIREIYHIESMRMEQGEGEQTVLQIVPIHTLQGDTLE